MKQRVLFFVLIIVHYLHCACMDDNHSSIEGMQEVVADSMRQMQIYAARLKTQMSDLSTVGCVVCDQELGSPDELEKELLSLHEKIAALEGLHAKVDSGSFITQGCLVDLADLLHIQSTSRGVSIVLHQNKLYAAKSPHDCEPFFLLMNGDHNLWYGDNGDLWGYDKMGQLFNINHEHMRVVKSYAPQHFQSIS